MKKQSIAKSKDFDSCLLIQGNILGCIDSYGAVHSAFTGVTIAFHGDYFPCKKGYWRWNHRESIHWFRADQKLNEEQFESVRNHLSRKYSIKWWDNGFHDIDKLMENKKLYAIDKTKD